MGTRLLFSLQQISGKDKEAKEQIGVVLKRVDLYITKDWKLEWNNWRDVNSQIEWFGGRVEVYTGDKPMGKALKKLYNQLRNQKLPSRTNGPHLDENIRKNSNRYGGKCPDCDMRATGNLADPCNFPNCKVKSHYLGGLDNSNSPAAMKCGGSYINSVGNPVCPEHNDSA